MKTFNVQIKITNNADLPVNNYDGGKGFEVTMDAHAETPEAAADQVVTWHAETFGGDITVLAVKAGSLADRYDKV